MNLQSPCLQSKNIHRNKILRIKIENKKNTFDHVKNKKVMVKVIISFSFRYVFEFQEFKKKTSET